MGCVVGRPVTYKNVHIKISRVLMYLYFMYLSQIEITLIACNFALPQTFHNLGSQTHSWQHTHQPQETASWWLRQSLIVTGLPGVEFLFSQPQTELLRTGWWKWEDSGTSSVRLRWLVLNPACVYSLTVEELYRLQHLRSLKTFLEVGHFV